MSGAVGSNFVFHSQFFTSDAFSTIVLPYFKMNYDNGEYVYMFTMGWMMVGRLLGGALHYRIKYPVDKKYVIMGGNKKYVEKIYNRQA